jgi:SAM-dependent methyltransferase
MMQDDELFLFEDWIYPNTIAGMAGLDALECGCGGGQHTAFMAESARSVTAVDLNTTDIARERNRGRDNVTFVEADIAEMDLGRQFDVVISIGVVHHTDDPDKTVANIARHVKPGGRLILWVYSREGNALVRWLVEPFRRLFLARTPRARLLTISRAITMALYLPVYTVYMPPLPLLPYYEYFGNFRKLTLERNTLNVFDKLNAPRTEFISRERIEGWFSPDRFRDVHISPYKGVSHRGSGTLL